MAEVPVKVSIQSALENGRRPERTFEKPCTYDEILNALIAEFGGHIPRDKCSINEPGFRTVPLSQLSQQVRPMLMSQNFTHSSQSRASGPQVKDITFPCMQSGPGGATRGQVGRSFSPSSAHRREDQRCAETRLGPTRSEVTDCGTTSLIGRA